MKPKKHLPLLELSALDSYISHKNMRQIHQTLINKLNVTHINKSKEPVLANLVKLKVLANKQRNHKYRGTE